MEPPNNPPPTAIHASLARLSRPNPVLAAIVNLNLKATIRRPLLLPLGLFALLMLYLGLVPRHQMPNWLAKINDKVLHAGCFGVLSVLMVLSWELEDLAPEMTDLDTRQFGTLDGFVKTVKRVLRTKVGITGLVMLAMGWGSELVQELLSPTRTYDSMDVVANLFGIAVGLPLGVLADRAYAARLGTATGHYAPV